MKKVLVSVFNLTDEIIVSQEVQVDEINIVNGWIRMDTLQGYICDISRAFHALGIDWAYISARDENGVEWEYKLDGDYLYEVQDNTESLWIVFD